MPENFNQSFQKGCGFSMGAIAAIVALVLGLAGAVFFICCGAPAMIGGLAVKPIADDANEQREKQRVAVETWIAERAKETATKTAEGKYKPNAVCMAEWQPDAIFELREELKALFPMNPIPFEKCLTMYHEKLEQHAKALGCWNEQFEGKDYLLPWRKLQAREKARRN